MIAGILFLGFVVVVVLVLDALYGPYDDDDTSGE